MSYSDSSQEVSIGRTNITYTIIISVIKTHKILLSMSKGAIAPTGSLWTRHWDDFNISFYRHALNTGRSSQEKSVRLSVCPSNAWIVAKGKKNLSRFLYIQKII